MFIYSFHWYWMHFKNISYAEHFLSVFQEFCFAWKSPFVSHLSLAEIQLDENKKTFSYSSKSNDSMKHCCVCAIILNQLLNLHILLFYWDSPYRLLSHQIIFFYAVIACATNSQKRCTNILEENVDRGGEANLFLRLPFMHDKSEWERIFSRQEISWWKGKEMLIFIHKWCQNLTQLCGCRRMA